MRISDSTLMRFHDGELDPERAREVRLARLRDRDVAERLARLEQLGALVRAWARQPGVDALRDRRALERRTRIRRSQRAVSLGAMAALAAGASVFAPPPTPVTVRAPAIVENREAPARALPAGEGSDAVTVERLELGTTSAAVFLIPGAERVTTVVWLREEAEGATTGTL